MDLDEFAALPRTTRDVLVSVIVPQNAKGVVYLSQRNQSTDFPAVSYTHLAVYKRQPLLYRNARAAFEQIDENVIYAARTLGISEWKIFWKIRLPMARCV